MKKTVTLFFGLMLAISSFAQPINPVTWTFTSERTGEKEFELVDKYLKDGVPLMVEVVESLKTAGEAAGVPFDLEPVG